MKVKDYADQLTQEIIDLLNDKENLDYSSKFNAISKDIENYVLNGSWDHTIDLDDDNLPSIRIIQEDEYDQHMDDEEKPDWEELLQVDSYYLHVKGI